MFDLFVNHYRESDPKRAAEYELCLRKNLENPYISTVWVWSQDFSAVWETTFGSKLQINKYCARPTFSDMFDWANSTRGPESKACIVSNSDVWFDDSLSKLENYDLTGKMLCLSRSDLQWRYSQDAWIFRPPVPRIEANFHLGVPGCDNRVAFEAVRSGLSILNPCLDICVHHEHSSGIRRESVPLVGNMFGVEPCHL